MYRFLGDPHDNNNNDSNNTINTTTVEKTRRPTMVATILERMV